MIKLKDKKTLIYKNERLVIKKFFKVFMWVMITACILLTITSCEKPTENQAVESTEKPTQKIEEKTEETMDDIKVSTVDEMKWIVKPEFDFDEIDPIKNYLLDYNEKSFPNEFEAFTKMAFVKKNNQTAMIDENGKIVIPYKKDNIENPSEYGSNNGLSWCSVCGVTSYMHENIYNAGGSIIKTAGGHGGVSEYFDTKSKKIVVIAGGFSLKSISEYVNSGYDKKRPEVVSAITVKADLNINSNDDDFDFTKLNKYILLKPDETTSEILYDDYKDVSKGLAVVKKDNQWGFVDNMGKYTMAFSFDDAFPFSDDSIAAVKKDDKWGYINLEGKETIPFCFEKATTSFNNKAWVKHNGKWGVYLVN